jgi:hypothetical protein
VRPPAVAAAALLILLAPASPAAALDAGDWQVGAAAEVLGVFGGNNPPAFPGLLLDARRALTDVLSVGGALGAAVRQPESSGPVFFFGTATAGVTFERSQGRLRPFVEINGVVVHDHTERPATAIGSELALGAELQITSAWSLAPVLRGQAFPIVLGKGARTDGIVLLWNIGFRLGRSF